ncbi:hypothetical protein [Deinococcus cellulosilyticus]|uniref:NERD domain-containing protein n=1 Tax=Deinococcus cellulosilyticus (strain DSM 18568 / NBRC 106333 / KACC 11606 / 5516J-15) TaxID=1223518 RepID=A0A511MWX5_DEIC1|nr:hypothetical protein [Deinococcus cellulosilyticus]GEM45069.1 hypothetical protein DC3_07040 [Deinococcus cellulosilyticus NBRC 106333 = KACC 11606]
MTIARVPSTYITSAPQTPFLRSVRFEENLYTLSDDWFIREDITVGRYTLDYVLVSSFGVFSLLPQKRSGVVHQQGDQIFVNNDRQAQAIQNAWHATQALEQVLGTRVHPVLVYRELASRTQEPSGVVGRRGYTAEAAESPEQTHWKAQGTLITSWEHLPEALGTFPHRVLGGLDVAHFCKQLRRYRQ